MEVINKFLFHCEYEKSLSNKTLKAYLTDLNQFKMHVLKHGVSNFLLIGKDELKEYLRSISTFKPKTIKRKVATLKAIFNFLEFEELIEVNPFRKIKVKIKDPFVLPLVMNINEVTRLFNSVYKELENVDKKKNIYSNREKVRNIAVIELMFGTGVRVAELCSLKYCNIGYDYSSICVVGKGNKERNIQIMNKDIRIALNEYYLLFSSQINKQQYFFINRLGNRLSEQSVRLMIRKHRNKCNIAKNITPHVFRHTFATLLLEKDVNIRYIQHLLGHSSIVTTQIYTHISSEKQIEIIESKHPRNELRLVDFKY